MIRHYNRRLCSRLCLAMILGFALNPVLAAEYLVLEDIAPESVEESPAALQEMGEIAPRPSRRVLRNLLAERSPFWSDSTLKLNVRTYDFKRESGQETLSDAIAIGTELTFRSGKWSDRVATVLSWHTSNEIDAPEDKSRTGLLGPDQSDLSVISRAYLEVELAGGTALRLYRQDFGMPYINRDDSRMIPNTHEAYVLRHPSEQLQYLVGHITRMKKKDSEEFISMGEIAGVEGNDNGTTVALVGYDFGESSRLAALTQYTPDLFNTTYIEANFQRTISDNWGAQLGAQVTNQWSVGRELLDDFNSYSWGLRGRASYRGTMLTLGFTRTGEAAIRRPFGGSPGFTSSMIFQFDRANENAYRVGLSHNFARLGYPGIGLIANYTRGRDAETNDGLSLHDTEEVAITVDLRPEKGFFNGLWLRLRYADADRGSLDANRRDFRIIINYSLEAL